MLGTVGKANQINGLRSGTLLATVYRRTERPCTHPLRQEADTGGGVRALGKGRRKQGGPKVGKAEGTSLDR